MGSSTSSNPIGLHGLLQGNSGGNALPARKADNLTTIYEPIVYTVWDPQHLATL
jgi:hypothetical protein